MRSGALGGSRARYSSIHIVACSTTTLRSLASSVAASLEPPAHSAGSYQADPEKAAAANEATPPASGPDSTTSTSWL